MSTLHTPGPWTLDSNFGSIKTGWTAKGPDGKSICACASSVGRPGEEKAANANLIAAAPDLLAALERAEIILAGIPVLRPDGKNPALDQIRDAIAKAKEA